MAIAITSAAHSSPVPCPASSLRTRYCRVRAASVAICEPLQIEDYVVQSMADTSPAKWHLAHTSWFFETFVLKRQAQGYVPFDVRFDYLFNSYYQTLGPMHERPQRGLLTRPTVAEVMRYRDHVDTHMQRLLAHIDPHDPVGEATILGLHHEQQHQELLLTDIKHLFFCNPLRPAYRPAAHSTAHSTTRAAAALRFVAFDAGIDEIGASGSDFHFDNEAPRHRVLTERYALAERLVTNGEYADFVRDGGYRRANLWLSEGWATLQREAWTVPLYWSRSLDAEFTLAGLQPLDPDAPVSHLSHFEADAFARWSDARLPTEIEWERAAASLPVTSSSAKGNLLDELATSPLHPQAGASETGLRQMYGDVWEWTASSYTGYPGYRPAVGALGEYNGKFMCNQWVLRGGSCVTPADHIRASYRNFFPSQTRWQFAGLRLARDA